MSFFKFAKTVFPDPIDIGVDTNIDIDINTNTNKNSIDKQNLMKEP